MRLPFFHPPQDKVVAIANDLIVRFGREAHDEALHLAEVRKWRPGCAQIGTGICIFSQPARLREALPIRERGELEHVRRTRQNQVPSAWGRLDATAPSPGRMKWIGWDGSPGETRASCIYSRSVSDHRLEGRSRMRRESHVRFGESGGVKISSATRPTPRNLFADVLRLIAALRPPPVASTA
jgi:hypothetical protein